ncbi:MAG: chromosome segregation protein SMC [Coriobacteriia bacterium]|nr:chromosome segregation protein SMC [Coriobacteriia bacterium]
MYLKSLIFRGFKSFADKGVMLFEPGVTVIVGPNGSGKSNISDAVLWVLGEQSAKSLRGQAMEDVIFAGSSARQPVGVAEVDLVLDNSDGTLPLEFSEVTITRRMFRNGDSEYLINQSPSRLMDIQDLLHDSGLGRDTHSIISQGRLDEVLNSRPEDRRGLIDEAAGVLKHKKRKERALRKLSAMDAYLARARDISSEIERQLRPLERQATRAQEHAALSAELREHELGMAVDDLRRLQGQWEEISKLEREADADIELSRYRLAEKERELAKFQSLLEEKGLFVGDLSEQRRRMQSILERLDAGLLLLEEKGKNLIEKLSELRQKLHQSDNRTVQRSAELERLSLERVDADGRLKALYGQLNEVRREAEAVRKARIAADEELSRLAAEIRRVRKQLEDDRAASALAEQALSAFRLEDDLLAERASQIRDQRLAAQATLSARRSRLDGVSARLSHLKRDLALADSDVDKRVRVLESRRRDLDSRRNALAEARAELRGLEEVDRAFAAASPALAWALTNEGGLPGLIGPVTEAIRAPKHYEVLVERLLGADLFGVLVADALTAATLADGLLAESQGELSVVPLSGARSNLRGMPTTGMRLLDELVFEESMRPAVEALLGDVFVVDNVTAALQASAADTSGARFATAEGAVVWPTGKLTLGMQLNDTESVLARKRRFAELTDGIGALSAALGDSESESAAAAEALSAAQQDALDLSQKIAACTGEHDSMLEEVGRLEQQLTTLETEASGIDTRIGAIRERSVKDQPTVGHLAEKIASATSTLESFEETQAIAREQRDLRFREESAVSERLSVCQVDIATVSEREVHLKRQLNGVNSELRELETAIRQSKETEQALELLRERIQPVHDLYVALQERAEHWAAKLKDRACFEQADSESLRETIQAAQSAVREVQAEIDGKSTTATDVRVKKGQTELQVNQAAHRIVEELGISLERALALPELEDRRAAEDRAHRLRKQISSIGPVNPVAMREFESLKARRDFMTSQVDDLDGSRKALHKVVAAIDRKVRDRFLEAFEQVDEAFQEIFAVLFPGGSARLCLTDPDDPDTTGVEVIAQPRGKKVAKMSLLSGGEKSLTALALLFAVYRTRPCPFYILDEVEAALDDTNLRRFVTFVDSMRTSTQFLIVTHQRRTMEMADVLYGVSMQADGVSKVVSQKLDRARVTAEVEHEPIVV